MGPTEQGRCLLGKEDLVRKHRLAGVPSKPGPPSVPRRRALSQLSVLTGRRIRLSPHTPTGKVRRQQTLEGRYLPLDGRFHLEERAG